MNFEKDLQGNICGIREILYILVEGLKTITKKLIPVYRAVRIQ